MAIIKTRILATIGILAAMILLFVYAVQITEEEDKNPDAAAAHAPATESFILKPSKLLYDIEPKDGYIATSISEIYTGNMGGKFVDITGRVINVLPGDHVIDNDGTQLEIIKLQVQGGDDDPVFVEASADKVKSAVQKGMTVKIKGYLSTKWMKVNNAYSRLSYQPHVYANSVTAAP